MDLVELATFSRDAVDGPDTAPVFTTRDLGVSYHGRPAIAGVDLEIPTRAITALIGPSGCGKSSLLRCFNRMNDLVASASVEGQVLYGDVDLYADDVDPTRVRARIGMVFQRPNPFPKSIYDNVAFGPRVLGMPRAEIDDRVRDALRRAALWDEVGGRLRENAYGLSGGQQQRLCIARALAVDPDVLLLDEPCSALDPVSTAAVEDLLGELSADLSIVMVTHNMQQAARVSSRTAFFDVVEEAGERLGRMVEYGPTERVFGAPEDPRTEAYVTGKFG